MSFLAISLLSPPVKKIIKLTNRDFFLLHVIEKIRESWHELRVESLVEIWNKGRHRFAFSFTHSLQKNEFAKWAFKSDKITYRRAGLARATLNERSHKSDKICINLVRLPKAQKV